MLRDFVSLDQKQADTEAPKLSIEDLRIPTMLAIVVCLQIIGAELRRARQIDLVREVAVGRDLIPRILQLAEIVLELDRHDERTTKTAPCRRSIADNVGAIATH